MTELLEKAFAEAAKLPLEAQDLLARTLLDEIAAEELWNQSFADSQDELAALADEALLNFRAGKTRKLKDVL